MKKQLLTTLTIISLMITCVNAQDQNSLLWKVEGDNIQTSYVFGTIHMLPQKDFLMPQKTKDAFASSDELYLELDMDSPETIQEMMSQMMITEGDQLSNHVDSTEYKFLDAYLKANVGRGFAQFNKFKPLFMSSSIMSAMIGKQLASYEMTFMGMAKEAGKELKGLETVDDQMSVFDGVSYEKQLDDLVEMLQDEEGTKKLYATMLEKYKSENIEELFDYMDDFFDNDKEMMNALLFDRNENWVKKIPEISKDKKILYAVGAGHLGGKKGIIQLLKDKGYKVTPVLN